MENGTKALIIIAAVLIVIIIISVCIRILTPTSGISDQIQVVSKNSATKAFNSQFERFFGSDKSSADAQTLVSQIIANNGQNPDHLVYVTFWYEQYQDSDASRAIYAHSFGNTNITKLQKIYNNLGLSKYKNVKFTIMVTPDCDFSYTMVVSNGETNPHQAVRCPGYTADGYISCLTIVPTSGYSG